jgi:hypothetical protein
MGLLVPILLAWGSVVWLRSNETKHELQVSMTGGGEVFACPNSDDIKKLATELGKHVPGAVRVRTVRELGQSGLPAETGVPGDSASDGQPSSSMLKRAS